ncbi:hypothetical protein NIES2100_26890 [Calothrix sp. NIES-2100]|nr:hypothetical protein NIES2100_26890 [Calothrix sp. NIES-2100]
MGGRKMFRLMRDAILLPNAMCVEVDEPLKMKYLPSVKNSDGVFGQPYL